MESYEESLNPGVEENHNLPFVLITHHMEDVLKLDLRIFLAHFQAGVILGPGYNLFSDFNLKNDYRIIYLVNVIGRHFESIFMDVSHTLEIAI